MSHELKRIKVTKCADRKVNLRGISSEYDNISRGTIISAEIEYLTEQELEKKMQELSDMASLATERDIRNELIMLQLLSDDVDNDCLIGMGPNLEYTKEEESRAKSIIDRLIPSKDSSVENNIKKVDKKVEKKAQKKAEQKAKSTDDIESLFGDVEEVNLYSVEVEADKDIKNDTNKSTDNELADLLFGEEGDEKPDVATVVVEKKEEKPSIEEKEETKEKVKDKKAYQDVDLDDFEFDDFTGGMLDD
jgi:hypothetical protein